MKIETLKEAESREPDRMESNLPGQVQALANEADTLIQLQRLVYNSQADQNNDDKLSKSELKKYKPADMEEAQARDYALKNFEMLAKGDDDGKTISNTDIDSRQEGLTKEAMISLAEIANNKETLPELTDHILYALGEGIPRNPKAANEFKNELNRELKEKGITDASFDIFDEQLGKEGGIGGGTDYVLYLITSDGTKTPVARKSISRMRC